MVATIPVPNLPHRSPLTAESYLEGEGRPGSRELARESGLDPSTIARKEADLETARGTTRSIEGVLEALARAGVEVGEDYVKLLPKPKPRARR
jgi:hypothetical protein